MQASTTIVATVALGTTAIAAPTWPNNVGTPMRHIMVSLDNGVLNAHVEGGTDPVDMEMFPGQTYFEPAGVLESKAYSDQFGWMAAGFLDLGPGNSIAIRAIDATPGLETYEGGRRMLKDQHTYAPIFGTSGSSDTWVWDGTMTHHWYAAASPGAYQATYRVFVADSNGNAVAGFADAFATLHFRAVPAPGPAFVLAGFGTLAARRRRGGAR